MENSTIFAVVDVNGYVKALSAGMVTITAKVGEKLDFCTIIFRINCKT